MGGCTNCKGKSGCDDRKGHMFEEIDRTLARLYPHRRWGEPDDAARFAAGITEEEGQHLAEELASELDAATFFRAGNEDEYCNYIYVLCMGREPCLVQLRDGGVSLPAELDHAGDAPPIQELYLRICLSDMARVAGVQEVRMELARHGGRLIVHEAPRAGVYDAPLLRRMQRLVAILPAYDITHLDFGEISAPHPDFIAGDYADRYGGGAAPSVANYLFFPQPATMPTTTLLDRVLTPGCG